MIACESGNLNVVRLLVEKHANVCVKNKVLYQHGLTYRLFNA